MPLYREDLDELQCSTPGCEHTAHDEEMFLHSACHTADPVVAKYDNGVITLLCNECGKIVTTVFVKERSHA